MEATRGNGYAPAWGSLVMMMNTYVLMETVTSPTFHVTQRWETSSEGNSEIILSAN